MSAVPHHPDARFKTPDELNESCRRQNVRSSRHRNLTIGERDVVLDWSRLKRAREAAR